MKTFSQMIFWSEDDIKDSLAWNGCMDSEENVKMISQYLEKKLPQAMYDALDNKIEEAISLLSPKLED